MPAPFNSILTPSRGAAVTQEECGGEGSAYETWQGRFPVPPTAAGLLVTQAGVRRVRTHTLSCKVLSRPMPQAP